MRAGESIAIAGPRLGASKPLRIGANLWYLAHASRFTEALKVRHGIVAEIGIADSELTQTPRSQSALMHSFY